jgi:hypothetical protein
LQTSRKVLLILLLRQFASSAADIFLVQRTPQNICNDNLLVAASTADFGQIFDRVYLLAGVNTTTTTQQEVQPPDICKKKNKEITTRSSYRQLLVYFQPRGNAYAEKKTMHQIIAYIITIMIDIQMLLVVWVFRMKILFLIL